MWKKSRSPIILLLVLLLVAAFTACRTPAGRTPGDVMSDGVITTKVKTKLFDNPKLSGFAIAVNTFNGEVTLSGAVDNEEQKRLATEVARSTTNVKKVNNVLMVKGEGGRLKAAEAQPKKTEEGQRAVEQRDLRAGAAAQPPLKQGSRASDLVDKTVVNERGQRLGQVEDIVISREGRAQYLILSSEKLPEGRLIPVEYNAAMVQLKGDQVVVSGLDAQKLENAPFFRGTEWQTLEDPDFERRVNAYYGAEGPGRQPPKVQY